MDRTTSSLLSPKNLLRLLVVFAGIHLGPTGARASSYSRFEGEWIDTANALSGIKIVKNGDNFLVYCTNPGTGERDEVSTLFEPRNGLLHCDDNTDNGRIVFLEKEDRLEVHFKRTTVAISGGGGYIGGSGGFVSGSVSAVSGGTQVSEGYGKFERLNDANTQKAKAAWKQVLAAREVEKKKKAAEREAEWKQFAFMHGNLRSFLQMPPAQIAAVLKYSDAETIILSAEEDLLRMLGRDQAGAILSGGGKPAEAALVKRLGEKAVACLKLTPNELTRRVQETNFVAKLAPGDLSYPLVCALAEWGLPSFTRDSLPTLEAFGPRTAFFQRLSGEQRADVLGRMLADNLVQRLRILQTPALSDIAANGWDGNPWGVGLEFLSRRYPNITAARGAPPRWMVKQGMPDFCNLVSERVEFFFNRSGRLWAVVLCLNDANLRDLRREMVESYGKPNGAASASTGTTYEVWREGSLEMSMSDGYVVVLRNQSLSDSPAPVASVGKLAAPANDPEPGLPSDATPVPTHLPHTELLSLVEATPVDRLRALDRSQILDLCEVRDPTGDRAIRKLLEARIGKRAVMLALWHPVSWEMLFPDPDVRTPASAYAARNREGYFNPLEGAFEKLTPLDITFDLAVYLSQQLRTGKSRFTHLEAAFQEGSAFSQRLKAQAPRDLRVRKALEAVSAAYWPPAPKDESDPAVAWFDKLVAPRQEVARRAAAPPRPPTIDQLLASPAFNDPNFDWLKVLERSEPDQIRAVDSAGVQLLFTKTDSRGKPALRELLAKKIGQRALDLALSPRAEWERIRTSPDQLRALNPGDITFDLALFLLQDCEATLAANPKLAEAFREAGPIALRIRQGNPALPLVPLRNLPDSRPVEAALVTRVWAMPLPPEPKVEVVLQAAAADLAKNPGLQRYARYCSTTLFISTRCIERLRLGPQARKPGAIQATQSCAAGWDELEGDLAAFFAAKGFKNRLMDYAIADRPALHALMQRREALWVETNRLISVTGELGIPTANPSQIEQASSLTYLTPKRITGWPTYWPKKDNWIPQ